MVWSGAQKSGTFCIAEVFQASPINCLKMNTTPAAGDYYELLEITAKLDFHVTLHRLQAHS